MENNLLQSDFKQIEQFIPHSLIYESSEEVIKNGIDLSRFRGSGINPDELLKQGFWTKRTRIIARRIVNYVHFWGLVPIKWDSINDHIIFLNSTFIQYKFKICFGIALFLHAIELISFLLVKLATKKKIDFDPSFAFHLDIFLISIFAVGCHIQTMWKIEEFCNLFNRTQNYYLRFQCKYAKTLDSPSADLISSISLNLFFFTMLGLVNVVVPAAYVAKCDLHVFSNALPICDSQDSSVHRNQAWIPFLLILQFYYANITVVSIFIYLYYFIITIIFGLAMERQLRAHDIPDYPIETISLLRKSKDWNLNYRIFQLLTTEINTVLGSIFLPLQSYCIVLSAVVACYFFIKKVGLIMQIYSISYIFLVSLYFIFILGNGAKIIDESEYLIRSKKYKYLKSKRSRYLKRFLYSCAPFKINFGPFMEMNGETVYMLFSFIPSNTVTMLLL